MASVDVVDETFLAVPPGVVAAAFAAPSSWRAFWPDLELDVYADRGDVMLKGFEDAVRLYEVRWTS